MNSAGGRKRIGSALVVMALALCTDAQDQNDWGRFRGPGGRGIALGEASYPVRFGPSKNLLWKLEVGPGHSSPSIFGDRIVLTSTVEKELETLCIDRTTGKVLWSRVVEAEHLERMHQLNNTAASTATVDGERVCAYFGVFGLLCYDWEGEELWRREIPTGQNTFGTAASPILAKGHLILIHDTNGDSWLEALDPATGKTIWRRERPGFLSGWSTPVVWSQGETDELLVFGVWWLTGYDLVDGSERWSVPGLSDEPIVTPVTGEGLVFVSSYNMNKSPEVLGLPEFSVLLAECDEDGDGRLTRTEARTNTSVLSRMDAEGDGDHPLAIFYDFLDADRDGQLTDEEWRKIFDWLGGFEHANALVAIRPATGDKSAEIVWQHGQGVPECPSPLYYEGRIYLVKNGGMVTCLDAATGKLAYQDRLDSRGPCYASPVAGDGKIFSASRRGVVTVFEAGDELNVLARNDLGEEILATPALVDGNIYVRTEQHLFAFGVAE